MKLSKSVITTVYILNIVFWVWSGYLVIRYNHWSFYQWFIYAITFLLVALLAVVQEIQKRKQQPITEN